MITIHRGAAPIIATVVTVNHAASPYTVLPYPKQTIFADTSGGVITLNWLNPTTAAYLGFELIVVKNTNDATVLTNTTPAGSIVVGASGSANWPLSVAGQSLHAVIDGTNHVVVMAF